MEVISKVTLHRGSRSVTVYVRDHDRRRLFDAALDLGVSCRSLAYARSHTAPHAWSSFIQMRLALHEDRAAPAAGPARR